MINRKTPTKTRDLSASKRTTKLPLFTRSVYEVPQSPSRSRHQRIQYTPQKPIMSIDRGEYGATRPKQRLANNLNYKIDSIIKHNSCLLEENNKLIEMLRQRQMQIQILQGKLTIQLEEEERGLMLLENQKNRINIQIREQIEEKDRQITTLLTQINMLSEEIQLRDGQYRMDTLKLKQCFSKESHNKLQNFKQSQINNIEIYESQLNKLKQALENKQEHIQQQQHSFNLKNNRLQQEVRLLNSEIKHLLEKKSIEVQQLKAEHQNIKADLIQKRSQQRDIQNANYENSIRKLKKDLTQKTLQNQRLAFRLQQTLTENKAQYSYIQQQKAKTQYKMQELQLRNKGIIVEERARLQELAEAQITNLELCHRNLINSLQLQKQKLIEINELKNLEIHRLNQQIMNLREANSTFIEQDRKHIKYLEQKLLEIQKNNQQQIEILKVKMAQLHNGDVAQLSSSYNQQISSLSEQIARLEQIVKDNREKLHEQLLEKTEQRKQFQIQISKLQSQNTQLKILLSAKRLEMKQSIENIKSKQSIESQAVIRDVAVSKKDIEKREVDIKKLHELINAKDIQIQQLNEIIVKIKGDFQEQMEEKQLQIQRLKQTNLNLNNQQKKQKEFYEKQLKKKDSLFREEKQQLQAQLSSIKNSTYEQLIGQLHTVQKDKLRLEAELSKEKLQKQTIMKSEATQKELVEVIRLESSSALQQQKDGSLKKIVQEGNKLKKFYQDQIQSKDKQLQELKRRLFQKDSDNRDTENKVADFQRKLQTMMDGQSKLRQLEVKTMNIGTGNNAIKNLGELFKQQR